MNKVFPAKLENLISSIIQLICINLIASSAKDYLKRTAMKLEKILDNLNGFEKNSFLKILDIIISNKPKNIIAVEKILSENSNDLKNVDNINIAKVFSLLESEFNEHLSNEFENSSTQIDIITDILIRDGHCIAKLDWFARLYENELDQLDKKLKEFNQTLSYDLADNDFLRKRDYDIYKSCIITAFQNDENNNQEKRITSDEQSILVTLAKKLELSQEEIKLINYSVIPPVKKDIESVINDLKSIGVVFYSRKYNTVYVAQEIVSILRKIRNKEVADKFFRRVLRHIKEPQINQVCKKHNIDKKIHLDKKIERIITEGISFSNMLISDIHKEEVTLNERKKYFNELCEKNLDISPALKGITIEEKVNNLIKYFNDLDNDERLSIPLDGYQKLLKDLREEIPNVNLIVKKAFELQEEDVLDGIVLLDYNLRPRDILEILSDEDLIKFCSNKNIKLRGDLIINILDNYKNAENLFLENYENIAYRNYNALKENGIQISEAEIGIKFENITKLIFTKLGFCVDEVLRKNINTPKDKIDIVINLGNNEIILIECKSVKESGYNKFSTVHRQLKAYRDLALKKNIIIRKSLLVAPEFSDEFINDCGIEYELNLSLIKASSLLSILKGFKESKHKVLPYELLMRDVLIQEERILKAIQ